MSEQKIILSLDETSVYSGACLTYSGVPFHRVEKMRTSSEDEDRLDKLFDRFVRAKGEIRRRTTDDVPSGVVSTVETVELALSDDELELLIEIFETILQEHQPPGEHSDYDLELHVGPREAVEAALERLRGVRQEQTSN